MYTWLGRCSVGSLFITAVWCGAALVKRYMHLCMQVIGGLYGLIFITASKQNPVLRQYLVSKCVPAPAVAHESPVYAHWHHIDASFRLFFLLWSLRVCTRPGQAPVHMRCACGACCDSVLRSLINRWHLPGLRCTWVQLGGNVGQPTRVPHQPRVCKPFPRQACAYPAQDLEVFR